MPMPDITSLQFLILSHLLESELPGRTLREKLTDEGRRMSGPAFYQLMARLEEAGLAHGKYEPKIVAGQTVKERAYSITGSGAHAVEEFRDFVLSHSATRLQGA
jgi:DNA-binding PadR family transcriptional regulator